MTIQELGAIGDAVGGLAAIVLAGAAIIGGGAGLGDWRAKQRAQRDLANEETNTIRINRQRLVHGWSPGNAESWGVKVVTDPAELPQVQAEMAAGGRSDYVVLRVTSPGDGAYRMRHRAAEDGFLARVPNDGEYEALEAGMASMGLTSARRARQRATPG